MCQYNWCSAGTWYPGLASSNAKILMFLKIKYTEAILPTALGNCYGLKIPKCWSQFWKINLLSHLLQILSHFRSLRMDGRVGGRSHVSQQQAGWFTRKTQLTTNVTRSWNTVYQQSWQWKTVNSHKKYLIRRKERTNERVNSVKCCHIGLKTLKMHVHYLIISQKADSATRPL